MAKKEETISLIDTFSEFKELKNIDRTTMVSVLEVPAKAIPEVRWISMRDRRTE